MQHRRQGERNRFPASSLGDGHEISAAQRHRPRLTLDGRGRRESLRANRAHKILGKPDLVECSDGPRDATTLDLAGRERRKRVNGRQGTHLDLFFPPEILYLSFRATGDSLVLDIEVLFEAFQFGSVPVYGSEATTKVTHLVIITASVTSVASSVTPAAIAVAITIITLRKQKT